MIEGLNMRPYERKGPPVKAHQGRLGHRCQKCGGYILTGGLRLGGYAGDIESCLGCGLSSESTGYTDVIKNEWVELASVNYEPK